MRVRWQALLHFSGHRIAAPLWSRTAYILSLRSVHSKSEFVDVGNDSASKQRSDFTGTTVPYPNYLIDPVNQPPSTPKDDVSERRLLGRARLHGISSAEQLHYETDIGHVNNIGTRLVDLRHRRNDLDLWLFLLEVNQQRHGVPGILKIWNAVRHRGPPLELSSDNANARDLVEAFIYAGIHTSLDKLKEICRICIQNSYLDDQLFVGVIGGLLRYKPRDAPELARYLRKRERYQGIDDFLQVFRAASESEDANALYACNEVCKRVCDEKVRVYHETIPYLWETKRAAQAFQWHQLRLAQRDLPQSLDILLPFVGYLACEDRPLEPFIHTLGEAGVDYACQLTRVYERELARFRKDPIERARFDPRLTKQERTRSMKDETVARALASSGFSFDFVLNSVRMLGALEVGPLSVRQMVLDAPDMDTLEKRFKRLEELDIDTGSSPFVNVIHQLRLGKRFDMLKLIAGCDMHHDEFGDMDLQHRLLRGYIGSNNVTGITRSLLIIRSGSSDLGSGGDHGARERITNLLLREAISSHDWQKVLDIVVSLHQTGHTIAESTLTRLADGCLKMPRPLTEGNAPQPEHFDMFDMTAFVAGLFQQILASGTPIAISQWRAIAIALAQHHRMDEMHRLLQWLIEYYSKGLHTQHEPDRKVDTGFASLFTPTFQRALIARDFKNTKWRDKLYPHDSESGVEGTDITPSNAPWLRGARLLADLSKQPELGVMIDYRQLQREYLNRIREMYNTRVSSVITSNKMWSAKRDISATVMMEQWMQVWEVEDSDTREIMYSSGRRIASGRTRKGRWAYIRDRKGRIVSR